MEGKEVLIRGDIINPSLVSVRIQESSGSICFLPDFLREEDGSWPQSGSCGIDDSWYSISATFLEFI